MEKIYLLTRRAFHRNYEDTGYPKTFVVVGGAYRTVQSAQQALEKSVWERQESGLHDTYLPCYPDRCWVWVERSNSQHEVSWWIEEVSIYGDDE